MPKVDIWSRLTPQSQAAVGKSREQYAALQPRAADALSLARAACIHERAYWNSFSVAFPSVQDMAIDTPAGKVPLRLYSARTEPKRRRIAIGGDSAGAHLNLAATLDARNAGAPAVCAQPLFYGAVGLKDSASRRRYGWADLDGLGDTDAKTFRDHSIADPADRDHPRVNLLKSDMAGLPPTFIGAVAYDSLRDDSLLQAELMQEQGVIHRLPL